MKLEYLWGQLANVDQILYEGSLEWGKGCVRFWDRLGQNFGFHGNRKRPLTYDGENNVSTFSLLFFYQIFFKLAGNKDRHKISDEFEFRHTPYRVRCSNVWKISHRLIMGKWCLQASSFILIGSSSNLLVARTGIKSLMMIFNIEIFRHTFLGIVRPGRLKLVTHVDSGQWADVSCIPESGCCCLFVPLFLHFSFYPIFNIEIFRHTFLGNWGLEDWKLVHTWTVGRCIMYTGIRLLLLSHPLFLRFSFSPVFNIEIFCHTFLRNCEA